MNVNSPSSVSSDTRARDRGGSTSQLLLAIVVISALQLTNLAAPQDNNAALRDHYSKPKLHVEHKLNAMIAASVNNNNNITDPQVCN